MTDRELMQQALEMIADARNGSQRKPSEPVITALRERLAQPEPVQFKCTVVDDDHPDGVPLSKWGRHPDQEPFCYHDGRNIVGKEFADHSDVFPLYTAPQPRQWVGLTAPEQLACYDLNPARFASNVESKLREKNA